MEATTSDGSAARHDSDMFGGSRFFLVVVLSSFNHKWYSVVCIRIVPVTGPYELACIILYRVV